MNDQELTCVQRELQVANNTLASVRAELADLQARRLMTLDVLGFHIISTIYVDNDPSRACTIYKIKIYVNGHPLDMSVSVDETMLEMADYVEHLREAIKHDLGHQIAKEVLTPTNMSKILEKIGVKNDVHRI